MTNISTATHKHLDAIDYDIEGGLLLAASSLNYRHWTGSLSYYDKVENHPPVNKSVATTQLEHGICDVKWIPNSRRLVSASDSGAVCLWELSEEKDALNCVAHPLEHSDIVSSVSVNASQTKAVSTSYDKRIKVWDIEEFVSAATYKGHADIIWSVACHPLFPDIFITCSQDGKMLIWDLRKPKPAGSLETEFLPSLPTCVAWQPGTEHSFAVATETGDILLQDCRAGVGTPTTATPHSRAVYRLAFAPHRTNWLASVSNDCTVVVTEFNNSNATAVNIDKSHSDFVQGVSWNPISHQLSTCSWDSTLLTHTIEPGTSLTPERLQSIGLKPDILTSVSTIDQMEVSSP